MSEGRGGKGRKGEGLEERGRWEGIGPLSEILNTPLDVASMKDLL